MSASASSDRRTKKRVPAQLRVDYKVGERISRAVTFDLSESGLFISTHHLDPEGSTIFLRLHLAAHGQPLKIVGRIRRLVSSGEGPLPGMGVQFQTVYGEDRTMLTDFLSQRLGRMVEQSQIGQTDNGHTFKYVFEPAAEPEPPAPPPAAPARPGSARARPSAAPTRKPPAKRVVLKDADALRELNFSYYRHTFRNILRLTLYGGIVFAIYVTAKACSGVFDALNSR